MSRSDWPPDESFLPRDPHWLSRIVSEALVAPIGRGLVAGAAVDSDIICSVRSPRINTILLFFSADFVSFKPQNTNVFLKTHSRNFFCNFAPRSEFLYTNSAFSLPCNFADHVSQHILSFLTFYLNRFLK